MKKKISSLREKKLKNIKYLAVMSALVLASSMMIPKGAARAENNDTSHLSSIRVTRFNNEMPMLPGRPDEDNLMPCSPDMDGGLLPVDPEMRPGMGWNYDGGMRGGMMPWNGDYDNGMIPGRYGDGRVRGGMHGGMMPGNGNYENGQNSGGMMGGNGMNGRMGGDNDNSGGRVNNGENGGVNSDNGMMGGGMMGR